MLLFEELWRINLYNVFFFSPRVPFKQFECHSYKCDIKCDKKEDVKELLKYWIAPKYKRVTG